MANDQIPPPEDTKVATDQTTVTDAAASTDTAAQLSLDATRAMEDRAKADNGQSREKDKQERDKLWDKDPKTGEPKSLNVHPSPSQLFASAQQRMNPAEPLANGAANPGEGGQPGGNPKLAAGGAEAFAVPAEKAAMKAAGSAGLDQPQQLSDKAKEKGKEADIPLDAATQQSKDNFLEQMKGRLNESDYKELESRLNQMDQRILHNKVQGRDGQMDQQQELKKTYDALNQLADGRAEGKDGLKHNGQNVYNQQDVNKIITDTVSKLADPENNFNQGKHNTCALQAGARQEAAISPSTYAQRQADIARTGEFQADGKTVKLDVGSLRLDAEARNAGLWAQGDVRGAAGHNNDIAMAQLNLNQKFGADAEGNGNRVYTQSPNPQSHGDTGERVIDRASGQTVGNSPEIDARGMSNVKQAAFGHRFSDTFGKDTTFVNEAAFGKIDNVSSFTSGEQMKNQLKANEAKGWQYSTIGMHTGHWSGSEGQGGAGGWHAVSVSMAQNDKVNVINNWGGKFNFTDANGKAQDADKVLSWMNDTANKPGSGYVPGDHNFDPDGKSRVDKDKPEDKEKKEPEQKQPEDKKEDKKKNEKKEAIDPTEAQHLIDALASVSQIQGQLDSLAQGDARRSQLQADKGNAERNVSLATGNLSRIIDIDV